MAWKILLYASGKDGGESKNSWSGKMVNEFERAAFAQEKEKSRPLSKQILDTEYSGDWNEPMLRVAIVSEEANFQQL